MIGEPLYADNTHGFNTISCNAIDARTAAANILTAYLSKIVWYLPDGERFKIKLLDVWPKSDIQLEKPVMALTEGKIETLSHNLTPTCLEDTYNKFQENTVLWKTGELEITFLTQIYADSDILITAISKDLPRVFSPTESRYGVILSGTPEYYNQSVRATLLDTERLYDQESIWKNDYRLQVSIRVDINEVHLRHVKLFEPVISLDTSI